ncbi:MAG: galactokinase [bacterium]
MISADEMRAIYLRTFGGDARGLKISRAPGRVNVIGEHTDYNDGFVMPVAIDRSVCVAARRRRDHTVNLYAADYDERTSFRLDSIEFDEEHFWANYIIGVADTMRKRGYSLGGADMIIKGDVPQGAGLSSSAAIEMATAKIFEELFNLKIDPVDMAYIGKSAENNFVGVQCGIMDQFISVLGRRNHALLIDCRTNEYDHIPLDPNFSVVMVNTTIKRELASSAYNERRRQCEEGVRILRRHLPQIKALRDVSAEEFERYQGDLPEAVLKRCRHVITENARVIEAVEALKCGDMERLGKLMDQSHISLRDDYEVSCRELDVLVESAREIPGTIGARMTGAGFGGCTVNIVRKDHTQNFVRTIKDRYMSAIGLRAEVYVSEAVDGAQIIS